MAVARALLAEGGYEALTYEAIAARAQVSRPTIYRRWPTKVQLANEIANGGGAPVPNLIETEGLDAQIRAFVGLLFDQYERPGMAAANAGLIVAYQNAPDLRAELHDPLEAEARRHLTTIIEQAKHGGLVDSSVDADALFDLAVGAVIFRTLFSSLPCDAAVREAVCAILTGGIRVRSG